jgi:hypothetical protein
MHILLALVLLLPQTPGSGTVDTAMEGGGNVVIRRDGDVLQVTVTGPRAGLASLCVGDASRVRILHASAAVGEALYESTDNGWTLSRGFDWKLRDAARTGAPGVEQREAFFDAAGWTANPSRSGAPRRDFRIRLSGDIRYVGVTFYATEAPDALSYWPASMNDDCRQVKVAQGFLPDTLRFTPSAWYQVQPR